MTQISRRDFSLFLPSLALVSSGIAACHRPFADRLADSLAKLELTVGGRLGVCVFDPATDQQAGLRLDERFGMCSTFKLALAGLILQEIDAGRLSSDQRIEYSEEDMVPYAPVAKLHLVDGGMTVIELAEAAQVASDNVAANLLLRTIGGPAGFTSKLRELGDEVTRLDRFEPKMNLVPQGEFRDTTTPRAMAVTIAKIVVGSVLDDASRELITRWMEKTTTGKRRLRAGLPSDWRAGDKTGTALAKGMPNKTNDVAVAWPRGSQGISITGYYESDDAYDSMRRKDEDVLAEVGRLVSLV